MEKYTGSVKDVYRRLEIKDARAGEKVLPVAVFEYSDAYSVFDWGRMPDLIPSKGESLAVMAGYLFKLLESPVQWSEFFSEFSIEKWKGSEKFLDSLKKLRWEFEQKGLATHFIGMIGGVESVEAEGVLETLRLLDLPSTPVGRFNKIGVKEVHVHRPYLSSVLGRSVYDYSERSSALGPKLIPLEVIFRFSAPEGSSLRTRYQKDSNTLSQLGFPDYEIDGTWEFPVLEVYTKLESQDRLLAWSEALAIAGMSSENFEKLLLSTALVAQRLKLFFGKMGVQLQDGKLEWAIDEAGELMLVDAIGPDELRLSYQGTQLSKEVLRKFYRKTPWYSQLDMAKKESDRWGEADWKKKMINIAPGPVDPNLLVAVGQMYQSLTNAVVSKYWFETAWGLEKVADELRKY